MTKRLLSVSLFFTLFLLTGLNAISQCPGGFTQAQLNWDRLDYYWNSGSNLAPYGYSSPNGNYVTNAMEQTQKFALGPNYVTIATSAAGIVRGENGTHTGNLTVSGIAYTGDDAQYTPTANGQTITLTFNTEVQNTSFTLYDIDDGAVLGIVASNTANVAQTVGITYQAGTILTTGGTPTARTITASATAVANNSNNGSATISVAASIKTITITVTTRGNDPVFWLSDITSCVTGTFPTNDNQTGDNQPMTGPTQNQPDYFIITPDNNSAYMVDPATGISRFLFQDASNTYMNSFAYDPYNKILYYISEGASLNRNNKTLKKYDFNTEASSVVLADVTTSLNIPTMNSGVESAGAAFYNGQLFLGFEGGQFSNGNPRESIVYRIDFDGSLNPVNACQVFGTNSNNAGGTAIHDWADFVIENGILYNYNSRPGTTIVSFEHFNMMTGASTTYLNPSSSTGLAYQSGLTWAGEQYSFASGRINRYFENGTVGSNITLTLPGGGAFPAGAGDASENFRPKCDFGDAPANYDPNPISPAVHEISENIRLGATWDREWLKRGVSGTDDVDDGLAFVPFMPQGASTYVTQVSVYNNSGADATLMAWLDYNGNGVFDAGEAAQIVPAGPIASSASMQSRYLYWPSFITPLVNGQSTYLRIRITSASAGMTAAHGTGYFWNGEVEDYRVMVDNYPLSVTNLLFNASLINNNYTKLTWSGHEENGFGGYELQRSQDGRNWQMLALLTSNGQRGYHSYEFNDPNPQPGNNFYRLMLIGMTGQNKYSDVKLVKKTSLADMVTVNPNPVTTQAVISIKSEDRANAYIILVNSTGSELYKQTVALSKGDNNIPLPVEGKWPGGTYMLRVTVNNETVHKKLLLKK